MKSNVQVLLIWSAVILGILWIVGRSQNEVSQETQISFSEFIKRVESGEVEAVTFKGQDEIMGKFKPTYQSGARFATRGPTNSEMYLKILRDQGITPVYEPEPKTGIWTTALLSWLPILAILFVFVLFMRQLQSGSNKALSFGQSKAKRFNENQSKIRFHDVAGCDEAKEDLQEVVDFLKNPKKYTKLGGRIPKGVLLIGEPGTGKTLLAKAVAGEASVPFFSISGSDFVEMFVGVGASRVRSLFDNAKKSAPCLIFIDEIDAVGRHRGAGLGGGHDEREQTLNQLLVEMDGFEGNEGVIVVAATNRVDVLDPALLRPGRFDRRVTVGRPDLKGRFEILKVHTKRTPLDKDVNLEIVARGTPGFTGANLENLVNEAALNAAREEKNSLSMYDFDFAKDKVLMGAARKNMIMSEDERSHTAYHEAGHALVAHLLPPNDPVYKVTIIPRGSALGVTMTLPERDQLSMSAERAEAMISFMMGGRVAEELVFGHYTTGASNDIERATELARKMVTEWGMSPQLGPLNYSTSHDNPFLGRDINRGGQAFSQETLKSIDSEIRRIVESNNEKARKIIRENKDKLELMALALLKYETIETEDIRKIMAGEEVVKTIISKPEAPKQSPVSEQENTGAENQGESVIDLSKPVKA